MALIYLVSSEFTCSVLTHPYGWY